MTDEQILELAKTCGMDNFTGRTQEDKLSPYWECWEEQLLKFAQAIYRKAYSTGHRDGYDDGWEGSKVSTDPVKRQEIIGVVMRENFGRYGNDPSC